MYGWACTKTSVRGGGGCVEGNSSGGKVVVLEREDGETVEAVHLVDETRAKRE